MSIIEIHLPGDVDARLTREAARAGRTRAEIAVDAISEHLEHLERERFQAEVARASLARGDEEALEAANEALPTDNEALEAVERSMP